MSILFAEPISTLFDASMYFNCDFDLLIFAHDTGEVKY